MWLLRILYFILLFLFGISCAKERMRTPFVDQILKLRENTNGLTFRSCVESNSFGSCKKFKIDEYDVTREQAEEFQKIQFICKVYNTRYKPCWYEEKFGICNTTYNGGFFGVGRKKIITFIDFESKHDMLMKAGLKCFNKNSYSWDDM